MVNMDEEYGSVMSFQKVPCTPISGAYASFFDVFGDVERIGTGSLEELTESKSIIDEKDKYTLQNRKWSGFSTTSTMRTDPHIAFLQQKQEEILGALHQEIRLLKHENSELKFQIHVILQQRQSPVDDSLPCLFQSEVSRISDPFIQSEDMVRNKQGTLELELESATKMIEELKWVQKHYERRSRMQEVKIEDLEVTSPIYQSKKLTTTTHPMKSSRQRSSTEQNKRELTNRRNSLQSILPDDYKESVATLPPILSNTNGIPFRATMATAPSALPCTKKLHVSDTSLTKSRKSSIIQSSSSLLRNNTPSFIGDNAGQHSGEAQFYFSK